MRSLITANDLLPIVARLAPQELKRLLTLLQQPGERDASIYQMSPPKAGEFSSDDDSLAWDADGWDQATWI